MMALWLFENSMACPTLTLRQAPDDKHSDFASIILLFVNHFCERCIDQSRFK